MKRRYHRRNKRYRTYKAPNYNDLSTLMITSGALIIIGFLIYFLTRTVYFILNNAWIIWIPITIALIALIIFIIKRIFNAICEHLVLNHSLAIKNLIDLNNRYTFLEVPYYDLQNSYDNENFYFDTSPLDYLTYCLVEIKDEVEVSIEKAKHNKSLMTEYISSVKEIDTFNQFDFKNTSFFKKVFSKKLAKKERDIFRKLICEADTEFTMYVTLELTNIKGDFKDRKSTLFNEVTIKDIINKLKYKEGDFYIDENIWHSVCQVERGKVTNRMRFAIYERDGNRCCYCGSRYDLEIDHIFPISKGGKSTWNNLQTLCHSCNKRKSNIIITPSTGKIKNQLICPRCHSGNLVVRAGKYGNFYGCTNYPECKFTSPC